MSHVSPDELVLFHYDEAADAQRVRAHLAGCGACRRELALLVRVLAEVDRDEAPVPDVSYGLRVWNAIEPRLEFQPGPTRPQGASWRDRLRWLAPQTAFAAAVAALLLAVALPRPATVPQPESHDMVLVGAVEDHLERTGLMLAELNNAEDGADVRDVPAWAEDLAAANRLYRQTAARAGQEQIGRMLDDLERVLLEVAHTPAEAGAGELETLRGRLDTRGVAFKVRAASAGLRAEMTPGETVNVGLD